MNTTAPSLDTDALTARPPAWVWWAWVALSAAVVAVDQWTKWLILNAFVWGGGQNVASFFNLIRVHNTGVAFSFLASNEGWQRWFFSGLGVLACGVMGWLLKSNSKEKLFSFSLAMIMGGAIGNVVDRLLHGYVVDFLDFYWGAWHFPAFNVADSAISVGAALLILDEILRVRRGR